jgi:hypothetical protein
MAPSLQVDGLGIGDPANSAEHGINSKQIRVFLLRFGALTRERVNQ